MFPIKTASAEHLLGRAYWSRSGVQINGHHWAAAGALSPCLNFSQLMNRSLNEVVPDTGSMAHDAPAA
eukprot:5816467-Pyramimonas_sp.AAC.1